MDGKVLVPTVWQQVVGGVLHLKFLKDKSFLSVHGTVSVARLPTSLTSLFKKLLGAGDAEAK